MKLRTIALLLTLALLLTVGAGAVQGPEATLINTVSLSIDAPAVGAAPAATCINNAKHYTVTALRWSPADAAFRAGTAYSVELTVLPDAGYMFASSLRCTINGVTVTPVFVGGQDEEVTISYAFDPLSGTAAAAQTAAPAAAVSFSDVLPSDWFYSDVMNAVSQGLVSGKSADAYDPNGELTYAEAIKLAACLHQRYHTGSVTLASGNPWYSTYMSYALSNGIIDQDYSDWANYSISRYEFVEFFYNALPESQYAYKNNVGDGCIPDVRVGDDYLPVQQIYTFYRAGILTGSGAYNAFYPYNSILRSEVAAILTRMTDASARKAVTLTTAYLTQNLTWSAGQVLAVAYLGGVDETSPDWYEYLSFGDSYEYSSIDSDYLDAGGFQGYFVAVNPANGPMTIRDDEGAYLCECSDGIFIRTDSYSGPFVTISAGAQSGGVTYTLQEDPNAPVYRLKVPDSGAVWDVTDYDWLYYGYEDEADYDDGYDYSWGGDSMYGEYDSSGGQYGYTDDSSYYCTAYISPDGWYSWGYDVWADEVSWEGDYLVNYYYDSASYTLTDYTECWVWLIDDYGSPYWVQWSVYDFITYLASCGTLAVNLEVSDGIVLSVDELYLG